MFFSLHRKTVEGWGEVKVARVIPLEDIPWGVFLPMKGTEWGRMFSEMNGDYLSDLLYGYGQNFMGAVGDAPSLRMPRIGKAWMCGKFNSKCVMKSEKCFPGSGDLPRCYVYPKDDVPEMAVTELLDLVTSGFFIVVVLGTGYKL